MASGSVVVHDIDALEKYRNFLQAKKDDLEVQYKELREQTIYQEENWRDPQYDHLKNLIDIYVSSSEIQLFELQNSIDYISSLIKKLRDV